MSEMVVQQLLREAGEEGFDPALVSVEPQGTEVAADWSNVRTPETYLSYGRASGLASPDGERFDEPHDYPEPSRLSLNQWAPSGVWRLAERPSLYDKDPPDSLRSVARARTLTVLPRLDGVRKGRVVQFLYESGLIARKRSVLDLQGADLSGAVLEGAVLRGAFLRSAYLRGTYLKGARLDGTDLSSADLGGVFLISADLREANLSAATLRGALLGGADLSNADLREAHLSEAFLSLATLSGADLSGADLSDANMKGATGVTNQRLEQQARSLEGATMPDGSKHP